MITKQDVEELLLVGHETRRFEVKGRGRPADKRFRAKIARAAMAMGNLTSGGVVCIGIDEPQMAAMSPGLDDDEFAAWFDFDNVSDALAVHSDPPVVFHLHRWTLSIGSKVVVLEVEEFADVPHVCKRGFEDELKEGMVYVRPRRKPESVPVPTATDLRDLLELATAKGVRRFIRLAGLGGVPLSGESSVEDLERQAFDAEAESAWSDPSETVRGILEVGHFEVAIRPAPYDDARVDQAQLERVLAQCVVSMRGWPVPFVDDRTTTLRSQSWIGQDITSRVVPHREAWRLCVSGQFLHRRVLESDMRPRSVELVPTSSEATGSVVVWDVLLYMVEVAEFAARLAAALAAESITFRVTLAGIAGRQLVAGDSSRQLHDEYLFHGSRMDITQTVVTPDLVQQPRAVGVGLAQQFLRPFGVDLSDRVLFEYQEQVFQR